jgi:hypothetical protein
MALNIRLTATSSGKKEGNKGESRGKLRVGKPYKDMF